MACESAHTIDMIAPVAGVTGITTCAGGTNPRILHIHRLDDCNSPYYGGLTCGPSGETHAGVQSSLNLIMSNRGVCDAGVGCHSPNPELEPGWEINYTCTEGGNVDHYQGLEGGHSHPDWAAEYIWDKR